MCKGTFRIETSRPMGSDRSPESQHNVGETMINGAQRQITVNLKQRPGINSKT